MPITNSYREGQSIRLDLIQAKVHGAYLPNKFGRWRYGEYPMLPTEKRMPVHDSFALRF